MKISVVTIALNAASSLPVTIESVLAQDYLDVEYIAVDGGSWDDSHSVFNRYKEIDKVFIWEDAGVYSAMNYAVDQCSGDYIIFMNAGDFFYSPHAISDVVDALDGEPDIVYGDHVYVDRGLELHKKSAPFDQTRNILADGVLTHRWHDRFPCHQATFTKRALLQQLGKYDTGLEICADHHFLLRAYDAGARFQYVDVTVAHYTGGGMSAQRTERLGLEFNYTYRNFSYYPQSVDAFFQNGFDPIFDSQSAYTGYKLSGFFPLEGPQPDAGLIHSYAWCAGEGFSIITPQSHHSLTLFIDGRNGHAGQELTIAHENETIGSVIIPVGDFHVEIPFTRRLEPGSVVSILPLKADNLSITDPRFASLMIKSFSFRGNDLSDVAIEAGREYKFGNLYGEGIKRLIQTGWSQMEDQHIWSLGATSGLVMSFRGMPQSVRFALSGNPWLEDSDRKVDILVNDTICLIQAPLTSEKKIITVEIGEGVWHNEGLNYFEFRPLKSAVPPVGDDRDLGICLHSLAIVGVEETVGF